MYFRKTISALLFAGLLYCFPAESAARDCSEFHRASGHSGHGSSSHEIPDQTGNEHQTDSEYQNVGNGLEMNRTDRQTDRSAPVPDREVTIDSAKMAAISSRIEEYLAAIVTEPLDVQKQEADFLIETCTDTDVRQAVALMVYSHFLHSKIMGAEAVAVHLCDKWFIPGKIKMHSDMDLMNAKIFAEFNRSSLLGMQAPPLVLKDSLGRDVRLFGNHAWGQDTRTEIQDTAKTRKPIDATGTGRYCILFFYATDCPKCRVETVLLKEIMENDGFPADLFCTYTGHDREQWLEYIHNHLNINSSEIKTIHLWDPGMSSDFQLKYGILQTPGMFLIDPDGKITGRKLDSISLEKLLKQALAPKETEYGTKASEQFYDKVFMPFGDSIECSDIKAVAEHIKASALHHGDTLLFKQMTGDLMYYLAGKKTGEWKCGLESLIRNDIFGNDIWKSSDDSLKVVSFARIMDDLLSRAAAGSTIPDIKVHATIKRCTGSGKVIEKEGLYSLRKPKGKKNIIIFYTEGCPHCKAERIAADKMLHIPESGNAIERNEARQYDARKDTEIMEINMDMLFSSFPDQAQLLFDTFDLTSLPYITITDRKGKITAKYVSISGME